jgi:outer membrane murein-binding lipoprotein Lpp
MVRLNHKDKEMPLLKSLPASARTAALLVVGGLSLSACATRSYVDEQIAAVNSHITAVDAKASDALQRADAAAHAAQTAETDAQSANQRIDQLSGRVDRLEQAPAERPRH